MKSAIGISRSSLNILMEGTPSDVNLDKIISTIINHNEIYNVHDYHVWTISNDMNALSCHAVVSETMSVQTVKDFLKIEHELLHLNIQHMTIQLETAQHDHDTSVLCSDYIKSTLIIKTTQTMSAVYNISKSRTEFILVSARLFYLYKIIENKLFAWYMFFIKSLKKFFIIIR